MLGQPISMLIPEVIGFRVTGKLREGVTATDLVLTVTQMLRKKGVVGKFVEFYGPGLDEMALEDRATIANMAPEYGATCGFFPIDAETLRYLTATGRKAARVALVEKYAKAQGLFRTPKSPDPVFTDTLELDLDDVEPSLAGPRRPQDRVRAHRGRRTNSPSALIDTFKKGDDANRRVRVEGTEYTIGHGDVVIAAITSCTNTSNPERDDRRRAARAESHRTRPQDAALGQDLARAGKPGRHRLSRRNRASTSRSTSSASSLWAMAARPASAIPGRLPDAVAKAVTDGDLVAAAVLSGNRNFEGRVHPQVRANYLASPHAGRRLCAGRLHQRRSDARSRSASMTKNKPVYLKDIWPSPKEIAETIRKAVKPASFRARYGNVFDGGRQLEEGQGRQRPDLCLGHNRPM